MCSNKLNLDNICKLLSRDNLACAYDEFLRARRAIVAEYLEEHGYEAIASVLPEEKLEYRRLPSLKSAYAVGQRGIIASYHNGNLCFVDSTSFNVVHGRYIFSITRSCNKISMKMRFSNSTEIIYTFSHKRVTKTVSTFSYETDAGLSASGDADFNEYRDSVFVKTLDKLVTDGLAVTSIRLPNTEKFHCCNDDSCTKKTSLDDAIYMFNNKTSIIIRHKFVIDGQKYEYLNFNICEYTMYFYNNYHSDYDSPKHVQDGYKCELYTGRVNVESDIMKKVERRIINDAQFMVNSKSSNIYSVEETTPKVDMSDILSVPGMTPEDVLHNHSYDYCHEYTHDVTAYKSHISCMCEGEYVPYMPIVLPRCNSTYALVFRDKKGKPTMIASVVEVAEGIVLLNKTICE